MSKSSTKKKQLFQQMGIQDYRQASMCLSKKRFNNEMEAIAACIRVSRNTGPLRYYRCPYCDGFHLTSQIHDDCHSIAS